MGYAILIASYSAAEPRQAKAFHREVIDPFFAALE